MKDKEKQNKQWQRRDNYCLRIQKALQYKGTDDSEDVPSILVDFENEIRKEILPKDSVVLSREEYEAITNDLDKGDYGELESGFSQGYKIGSKETAEKILKDIYRYNGSLFGTCFHKGHYVSDVRDLVKDIAEEYKVKIKE